MTNEEAIKIIDKGLDIGNQMPFLTVDQMNEAKQKAIKALEQEPSDISNDGTLTVNVEDGRKISRVLVCGANHWGGLYYPDEQEPKTGHYEKHIDHTDCIWYGSDSGCPFTCSQYRDGWNDAMDYIFKNGNGYQPYRHDGRAAGKRGSRE